MRRRLVILLERDVYLRSVLTQPGRAHAATAAAQHRCKYRHIIICKYSWEQVPWVEEQHCAVPGVN